MSCPTTYFTGIRSRLQAPKRSSLENDRKLYPPSDEMYRAVLAMKLVCTYAMEDILEKKLFDHITGSATSKQPTVIIPARLTTKN